MDNIYDLLRLTYDVTHQQVGGLEIIQSLRAVGPLQELRLASHRLVAEQFAAVLAELLDRTLDEAMTMRARLSVDTGYAIVEMALEDTSLDTEQCLRHGAEMLEAYWAATLAGS